MSGTNAKALRVGVVAHDGTLLGYVNRKPLNANWRMLGRHPRIKVHRGAKAQDCERNHASNGWRLVLAKDGRHPADMEAP